MYTKTEICAEIGISTRTFERYRVMGIIAPPKANGGRTRYYSPDDLRRIREARRTAFDDRITLAGYAEIFPLKGQRPPDRLQPTGD